MSFGHYDDGPEKAAGWRERLKEFRGALTNLPKALALLWEADPYSTLGMGATALIGAALPASQAWVTKLVIDSVVGSIKGGTDPRQGLMAVLPYLFVEFALIMASTAVSQFRGLIEELIDHRLGQLINTRIIRKALSLEAKYFEDPAFYDKMQNARRQSEYRTMSLVNAAFLILQNALTLLSFLTLLLAFSPWVALLLFGATVPAFVIQAHYARLSFRLQTWRTPETRNLNYIEQLLTQDSAVKEVKLFALGEPLLERYNKTFLRIFQEDARLAKARSLKSLFWGMGATLSYYACYAWVLLLTVGQKITLGDMTLYLTLFRQSQGVFQGLLYNLNNIYENGLFLDNLFAFLALPSQPAPLPAAGRPAEDLSRGIEFKDVWFRYPGEQAWVVEGFSLSIAPGEKLALVGENGAGKTTLIKLLTRLYEPTRGEILFHGVDLRYFSQEELHLRIGALFQDFVRYQLTLRENIGFGSVQHVEDLARVGLAAEKSGAARIAESLPERFESRLGRWFEKSHELSGGQWQKVALGRAYMREAEVLVLDEPTAALDAQAEYETFERFRELSAGRTVLLVSHRFSTVRMADRIAVLENGKLLELGTHRDLVKRGGTYARLFELQAQGYR